MFLSAEMRWFWRGSLPSSFKGWFCELQAGGFAAGGGGKKRTDAYLVDPDQRELGLKNRGGGMGVEVKCFVGLGSSGATAPPFLAPVQFWTKVLSEALSIDTAPLIAIEKLRWLRKFDTTGHVPVEVELDENERRKDGLALPRYGCNVELTEITIRPSAESWWTFGFEAFGLLATVEASLQAVTVVLSQRSPPSLRDGIVASYPSWLADLARVP
jgi:hypothetical protein